MKRLLIGFLAGLALGSFAHGEGVNNQTSLEQPYAEGGTVWLKLKSGDYRIRAGASDKVVVQWNAENSTDLDDMRRIRVRTERSGDVLTIRTEGPTDHARFTIDIPARSDLFLRMRAGEVHIDGIEGNKDIRMTAGDVNIEFIPAMYSRVHASVTFGDLAARPLGISQDGIKRSFNWTGGGKYKLHASLFAGDLILTHR